MKDFVVVATFTYPHEYQVLKLMLRREEIPHVFENETMVSVSPFYSNALGGIKLKVHREDVETVKSLLEELNNDAADLHIV